MSASGLLAGGEERTHAHEWGIDPAVLDSLFSRWIDRSPRFGAVAAHFPESQRKRRFVAGFWFTRPMVDQWCSRLITGAGQVGAVIWDALTRRSVDIGKPRFWSPELPEVEQCLGKHSGQPRLFFRGGLGGRDAKVWIGLLLLLCLALPASAGPGPWLPPGVRVATASVQHLAIGPARVIDGDTLEVAGQKVRLHGIDAPEKDQLCQRANGAEYHCGALALVRLEELIGGRRARCLGREKDRYGRLIARCYVAGEHGPALDLGGALVIRGLAVAYRKYSSDYNSAEATAKAAKAGIWAGTFVAPELWRKGVRK